MGKGILSRKQSLCGVVLTTGFHLVPRLQMREERNQIPLCAFMLFREKLTFTFNGLYFGEGRRDGVKV